MANRIKYGRTPGLNTLLSGDWSIGTNVEGMGPSSETGFFQGVTPPTGGYALYTNVNSNFEVRIAKNDGHLIEMLNQMFNSAWTRIEDALAWCNGNSGVLVLNQSIPDKVTDGLILDLESNNVASYPKTGSRWFDLTDNCIAYVHNGQFDSGYLENVNDESNSFYVNVSGDALDQALSQVDGGWVIEELIWTNSTRYPEADAGSVASGSAYSSNALGFDWNHGQNNLERITIGAGSGGSASGYEVRTEVSIPAKFGRFNSWRTRTLVWDRDANMVRIYIDGQYINEVNIDAVAGQPIYDGGGIAFGTLYGWKHYGRRGSIKVWNRVLSEEEIRQSHVSSVSALHGFGPSAKNAFVHWEASSDQSTIESPIQKIYDLSGNANHSHNVQGTINVEKIDGVDAWKFDAATKFINADGAPSGYEAGERFTIEATIRAAAGELTSGDRGTIFVGNAYMSWNKSNNKLSSYWYGTDNRGYHELGPSLERERWYHLVSVWTGKQMIQYIDGVEVGRVNTNIHENGGLNRIRVGAESSGRQFAGHINRVRLWDRALGSSEVKDMADHFLTKAKHDAIEAKDVDGGGWTRFWWYDGTTGKGWPEGETDVLKHKFGTFGNDSHYGFQRLPKFLNKEDVELLAADGDGNIYKWDFGSTTQTAQRVWDSFYAGEEGRWGHTGTWNPTVIAGQFRGVAQDSWQYRMSEGVKSFMLDDDTCDCYSTLNAGHAMCGSGWNQTYAQPDGAHLRYGVDSLYDPGCQGPVPERKLELFYRVK